jgi:IclR family transcriptional regulator, acetate operon repressor
MTMPAHCTAAGKAILAQLPTEAVEEYLDALPAGLTPRSLSDRDAVRAELELTAARGYGTNFEESEDGLSAVGAAIPEPSGVVRSALTISFPAGRLPPERAADVAEAAIRGAQAVGARLLGAATAVP